jgi:RimJ/RimL family protein N-acetyltransferase
MLTRLKRVWASAWFRLRNSGLKTLVSEASLALWRRAFDDDDYVFVMELSGSARPWVGPMPVESYARAVDVPPDRLAEIRARVRGPGMPEDLVEHYMKGLLQLFDDGAQLWLPLADGQIVGVVWTLESPPWPSVHFPPFPLERGEVLLFAGWVFREFRGKGLYPSFLACVASEVERRGARRIYALVKVWNAPGLKAMPKVGFARIGRCRTVRLGGRSIVLWRDHAEEGSSDAVR